MGRRVLGFIALTVWLAVPTASAQAPRKFTMVLIPGSQEIILSVMERQHLLKKYNLEPQIQKLLSPAGVHPLIVEGKVDLGFGGATTFAVARAQGRPVLVFSALLSPTSFVLALKDSPIKSLADLKGKKLGLFGGPQAAISAMLFIIGKRRHGVDLSRESQLITAPNPALAALLDKKGLDAALFGSTESLTLFLTGRYKIIADIGEEWERQAGRAPAHVVMATTEAFAKANPDLLRDFVRAYRDAVRYIREHPEVWEEWGRKEGITSKEGIQLLRERIGPRIVDVWDRKQMEAQRELLEIMIEVLGEKFLKAVPAGLMTDAYVP